MCQVLSQDGGSAQGRVVAVFVCLFGFVVLALLSEVETPGFFGKLLMPNDVLLGDTGKRTFCCFPEADMVKECFVIANT